MRARGGVPSRPRVHPRKQRQPFPPRDRFDNDTNWETHTPPVVFRAFLCVVVCVALRRGATPFTKLQDGHTKKEKKQALGAPRALKPRMVAMIPMVWRW